MEYLVPVRGRVTSKFGPRIHPVTGVQKLHTGVDIAAPIGTPVYAPADSRVRWVGTTPAGGIQVSLQLTDGVRFGFAHLDKVVVAEGNMVRRGDVIAYTGKTGKVTGPHLHFSMNHYGGWVDPEDHFKFD